MKTLIEIVKSIEPHLSEADRTTISKGEFSAALAVVTPDVDDRHVSRAWKDLLSLKAFAPIRGSKNKFSIDYRIIDKIAENNGHNPFTMSQDVIEDEMNAEELEIVRKHMVGAK